MKFFAHIVFFILLFSVQASFSSEYKYNFFWHSFPFAKFSVEYSGSTPGDQFGITGNPSNAKLALNWSPKIDLLTGLEKTCKWALNK